MPSAALPGQRVAQCQPRGQSARAVQRRLGELLGQRKLAEPQRMLGRVHEIVDRAGVVAFDGQRREPQLVADVGGRAGREVLDQRHAQRPRGVRRQRRARAGGVERMRRIDQVAVDSHRADGFGLVDGALAGQRRHVAALQRLSQCQVVQDCAHRRCQTGQVAVDQGRQGGVVGQVAAVDQVPQVKRVALAVGKRLVDHPGIRRRRQGRFQQGRCRCCVQRPDLDAVQQLVGPQRRDRIG